jgi:hypothetical protein
MKEEQEDRVEKWKKGFMHVTLFEGLWDNNNSMFL